MQTDDSKTHSLGTGIFIGIPLLIAAVLLILTLIGIFPFAKRLLFSLLGIL